MGQDRGISQPPDPLWSISERVNDAVGLGIGAA